MAVGSRSRRGSARGGLRQSVDWIVSEEANIPEFGAIPDSPILFMTTQTDRLLITQSHIDEHDGQLTVRRIVGQLKVGQLIGDNDSPFVKIRIGFFVLPFFGGAPSAPNMFLDGEDMEYAYLHMREHLLATNATSSSFMLDAAALDANTGSQASPSDWLSQSYDIKVNRKLRDGDNLFLLIQCTNSSSFPSIEDVDIELSGWFKVLVGSGLERKS